MTTLRLRNIGQLTEADLHFGDLTVFVGPQATGKSIALQFLKLMVDTGQVQAELVLWLGLVGSTGPVPGYLLWGRHALDLARRPERSNLGRPGR